MIDLFACPACGEPAADSREVLRKEVRNGDGRPISTRVVACACGHVFINPQPIREELAPFYQTDYHVFADQAPDPGRMLIGCWLRSTGATGSIMPLWSLGVSTSTLAAVSG